MLDPSTTNKDYGESRSERSSHSDVFRLVISGRCDSLSGCADTDVRFADVVPLVQEVEWIERLLEPYAAVMEKIIPLSTVTPHCTTLHQILIEI